MVSTLITSPVNAANVDASKDIQVNLNTIHLVTGFFNDPATQYYLSPQTLDPSTGFIQGHQHVTVQPLISLSNAPDPSSFAFFKGLNNPAADGVLSVIIPAGTFKHP
jgi:hypothetical protein